MAVRQVALALALLALITLGEAARVPGLPSWAKDPKAARWRAYRYKQLDKTRAKIAAINRSGQRQDFLLYGCSVVTLLDRQRSSPGAWDDHFGRGWRATAMGISGSDVADVVWRLLAGGERPAKDPKVIGFLMAGHDDLDGHKEMDFLLGWVRAAMPGTKALLMGILPFRGVDLRQVNKKYAQVAKRNGATFLDCGRFYDPTDKRVSYDYGHPTVAGQKIILDCMLPVVKKLARK